MNLFERASRAKLRFATRVGELPVEDLWDLPLTGPSGQANLNDLARGYSRELKSADESFVDPPPTNDLLQLRFDLVKHIIDAKVAERDARAKAQEKAARRRKLLEALANRKDAELQSMSAEDLEKELAALDA